MQWDKYTVKTTNDAVDIICSCLYDMGITGIEIEDNIPLTEAEKKQMYVDILPPADPDDDTAAVSFYAEKGSDVNGVLKAVEEQLEELSKMMDVGEARIIKTTTEDTDWADNWKQYWKPFKAAEDIWIKPAWETLTEEETKGCIVVDMDPGSAFGTGTHHTTRLCIEQLRKYMKKGCSVLDIGCGSGILFIIADKLGAETVKAVDIDPNATDVALENAEKNGISAEHVSMYTGNVLDDPELRASIGEHDIVLANILAQVIIPLNGVVKDNLKPGAVYIVSGIIDEMEEAVRTSLLENGFEILETTYSGEWVSFTSRYGRE
ncbi:MAG: 50S ribosomal protein L11 methyltransferase [Lachnospiraceae bacterium]|nr:50S ribosomal protein L11 methyltransferase [Lachnospiraceae bacterium]